MSKFLTTSELTSNHGQWGNVRQLLIKRPSWLHVSGVRPLPSCNALLYNWIYQFTLLRETSLSIKRNCSVDTD